MALTPAWAVDGGRVPAAVARMLAWCGTQGSSGVVLPTDMKVQATATASAAVNILTGGALVASTYATASKSETYACSNDATSQLAISATAATGRTDYVILAVQDWHYDGSQEPADPLTADYCAFLVVSSIVGLAYPFIPLAKIVIPANTATIANSMITDLRSIAVLRSEDHLITRAALSSDTGLSLGTKGSPGEVFPNIGNSVIDVPAWATKVQVVADWNGVAYSGGNPYGNFWVEFGPSTGTHTWAYTTQQFSFDSNGANQNQRVNWRMADEVSVPAGIRGTSQPFVFKGMYNSGSTASGVSMTATSGVDMLVRFLGYPDPDVVAID